MDLRAAKYTATTGSHSGRAPLGGSSRVDVGGGLGALVIDSSNNNNNERPVVDGVASMVWDGGELCCSAQLWANFWRATASRRPPPGVNEKLPWQLPGSGKLAGQAVTSIDPVSVITASNTTTNNATRQQFKALEHSINNLVEASCSASSGLDYESALRLARQAADRLSSLRAQLASGQSRVATGNHRRAPQLTSGPNASELALMVDSNLAAQLAMAGQRREAIELYVDLCKLANSNSTSTSSQPTSSTSLRPERQLQQATGRRPASLLMYRFGLNIGNLYCELAQHQQALKYYRLTIDRLSSLSADYQSLRVKLMNNIVCCQLIQRQALPELAQEQAATLQADTINSLHHLLAENTRPSMTTSTTTGDPKADMMETIIGRQHLFGLALVALLGETGADAASMTSAWQRHLVGVPVCHHYWRVSTLPAGLSTCSTHQFKSTSESDELGALPAKAPREPQKSDSSATLQQSSTLSELTGGQTPAETRDQLELLIEEKQRETHRALLTCSQLILEQANHQASDEANERALFELCLGSLSSSANYKRLAVDLKMNRAGQLLRKQLYDEPLEMLRQLSLDARQQQQQQQQGAPEEASCCTSLTATNFTLLHLLLAHQEEARECGLLAIRANTFNHQTLINLANYYLQVGDLSPAYLLYRRALDAHPQSCQANYNLALLARKLATSGGHLFEGRTRGEQEEQLRELLRAYLISEHRWLARLSSRGMILALVQLAEASNASSLLEPPPQIAHSHHRPQQSGQPILRQLQPSLSWPAPEIYLLLAADQTTATASTTNHNQQAIALLQQAHKEHPYHLPVLERLIALHIQAFNYEAAKPLLMSCIQNQPDQVKWYRLLAECHKRAADYATAISIYKTSVNAFPRDTSCLKALINLTSELGMTEERDVYEKKLTNALKLNELLPENVH